MPAQCTTVSYEELIAEALAGPFSGWDFSWLSERTATTGPSWSYPELARSAIRDATRLLDIDTGGGENLADLAPLPHYSVAAESWEPNIPIARKRLQPLGVEVRQITSDRVDPADQTARENRLPADDGEFDLVLNRHGHLDAAEIWRALAPGGRVLTQQVGSRNDLELNIALEASVSRDPHTCELTVSNLERQGFDVLNAAEEFSQYIFYDIGAVVYHLRAVPWTVPGFSVVQYEKQLRRLDALIRISGRFVARNHRFLISARKP